MIWLYRAGRLDTFQSGRDVLALEAIWPFAARSLLHNLSRQADLVADTSNSFKSRQTLTAGGKAYAYFSLPEAEKNGLADISRLPNSLKVVLENLLRFEDGRTVSADDVKAVGQWLVNRGR